MIRSIWDKLDQKQRYLVSGTAVFVLLALVFEFALVPFWDAKEKLKKTISASTLRLEEMKQLDTRFALQAARIGQVQQTLASRRGEFTLFSYLDKKALLAGVKGSIRQMNSVRGTQSASFEEALVEMRLEKITMKQLTDFLYHVEAPAEMIRVKRITVTRMKESPEYLACGLLIAAYLPAAGLPKGQ
ncbi:MAG: hypothetical protein R6W75_01520 [Smithellaceae bacterium]